MEPFVDIANLPDLPAAAGMGARLGEHPITLFWVDGDVFALDDACARCGESLASGALQGYDVECAACGWHYDIVTGRAREVPKLRLDTFAVHVRGSVVSVANRFAVPLAGKSYR
jgi:nitrite reductase/ring-hydroxylating ferredoxin subunit